MSHSTCTVFMITDCVLNFLYYLRGYYLLFFNLVNSWIDWFSFIFGWLKEEEEKDLLKDLESGEQKILLSNHLTTIYIIYFWRNHYEF